MKKLQMVEQAGISFEEGCEKYILDCTRRNLRDGTISHYRQSYRQFYKYIDPDLPLADFTKSTFDGFVLILREKLNNDISINSYLRDLITTLRFFSNMVLNLLSNGVS